MPRKPQVIKLPDEEPSGLSEQQRAIYRMAKEGKKAAEIAEALRTTRDNVDHQLQKIRKKTDNLTKSVTPRVKSTLQPDLGMDEDEFNQLAGNQAKVIYLTQRGKSVADAARVIGIEPGTARQYLFKARHGKGAAASPVKTGYIRDLPEEEREKIMAVGPETIDPVTAAFAFQALVEGDAVNRKDLCALARERMGGWQAKKVLIGARAQAFKVLAVGSRTPLIKVSSPAVKKMMADVLAEHFSQMTDEVWRPRTGNANQVFEQEFRLRSRDLLAGSNVEPQGNGHYNLIIPDEDKKGIVIRPMPDGLPGLAAGVAVVGRPAGKQALVGVVEHFFEDHSVKIKVAGRPVAPKRTLFSWGKGKKRETYECQGTYLARGGDEVGVSEDGTTLTIRKWVEDRPDLKLVKLTDFDPNTIADMAAKVFVRQECTIWYKGKAYRCCRP